MQMLKGYMHRSSVLPSRFNDDAVILEGDVAVRAEFLAIAVFVRTSKGKLMAATTKRKCRAEVLRGEISTVQMALKMAEENNWQNIIIRSDSIQTVEALSEKSDCADWR